MKKLEQKFQNALDEIRLNSKTESAFIKRFFRWFDAFKVLKFMHFLRDNGVKNQPVFQEVTKLLLRTNNTQIAIDEVVMLLFFRDLEKK